MKRAVGYVRGRLYRKKWTPDVELQKQQIREYADAYGYELIALKGEDQRLGIKKLANALVAALRLCTAKKADFLYVDFGNRRPNTLLNQFLKNTKPETKGWRFVAIPADRETLEAMERQARVEEFNRRVGAKRKQKPKAEDQKPRNALEEYQQEHGISTKRLKNFQHLSKGVSPIYKYLLDQRSSAQEIADDLHDGAYLTVDGKRWTADNVRRSRKLARSGTFQNFISLIQAEKGL